MMYMYIFARILAKHAMQENVITYYSCLAFSYSGIPMTKGDLQFGIIVKKKSQVTEFTPCELNPGFPFNTMK